MSTAAELIASDAQLQTATFQEAHQKYSKLASAEQIEATRDALKAKGYAVSVAQTGADALELVKGLIPEGATVHNTASVSLAQIGFVEVLKGENGGKWSNLHGKALTESGGNPAKLVPLLSVAGATASHVVASVDGITENGEIVVADGSGTRIVPFVSSTNVIVVIGANKLVKDLESARDRVHSYTFALESARVRKVYGWPSSMVSNLITLNPAAYPSRFNIVIVNEHLGF